MGAGRLHLQLIALTTFGVLVALILVGTFVFRDSGFITPVGALVYQRGSGPGGGTTEVFTATGDWDLHWSYDCTPSLAGRLQKVGACDFRVTVKEMSYCQVSPENPGVVRHGGPDHGVIHYHTGGTYYFVVDSYGSWTVSVTGAGRASGVGPEPHCSEG